MAESPVVSFRCPPELAQRLAELGAATDNTRANVVYLLVLAALNNSAPDVLRLLKGPRS